MPNAPLIVVNPAAGGGRAAGLVPWIRERLEARTDADLHVTVRPGEAEEVVAGAVRQGRDRVVAVGGDGTVQEAVNGIMDGGGACQLGVVPVGTGNDLARSLGLPGDPGAAWTVALGSSTRRIDIANAVNGDGLRRWFASAGGIGFDAQVAAAMAARRGWQASRAGYLLTTLSELRRFENRRVVLTIDGASSEEEVLFVAIANGAYYGGGMRIAPEAQPDDGRLDICVVGNISRMTALRQLPNLYRGTHIRHPAVSMRSGASIAIDGDGATRAHLDGEPFGALPLHIRLSPAAIEIATPHDGCAGPPQ